MTQQINLIDAGQQGGRDWVDGLAVLVVGGVLGSAVLAHYAYEYRAWQVILQAPAPAEEAAADPADAASDPLSMQLQLAEAELAGRGRLVIRPSGTEPVIRVMAEGEDKAQVETLVDRICDVVREVAA